MALQTPEPESEANVAPKGDGPSLFEEPPLDVGAPDETLDEIRADLGECIRCKLHTTRTHIVFGEGSPTAELMFIGVRRSHVASEQVNSPVCSMFTSESLCPAEEKMTRSLPYFLRRNA